MGIPASLRAGFRLNTFDQRKGEVTALAPILHQVPGSMAAPLKTSEPHPAPRRFWVGLLVATTGWLAYILSLELLNPRLVPSWHGFLHTAIVRRFPSPGLIPENPVLRR
jgi:uncharacterized membrane protein YjjB (DUF3815 family)